MLSHSHQALFVHVPKVAGQSIELALLTDMGQSWQTRAPFLLRPNNDVIQGPPRLAHLTACEYLELGYIDCATFDAYFKFSFVRNPWARLYSEFRYRQALGVAKYQCDFKAFLFERFPVAEDDCYTTHRDLYRHVVPQSEFLYDQHGQCLMDFVGRFENLTQDFAYVANKLNLQQQNLPHKNNTQQLDSKAIIKRTVKKLIPNWLLPKQSPIDYRIAYDNEMIDWVAAYYAKDIVNFGYTFDK
ncbi:sulfotransferase family 2 domain-containing protein [Pseudoalteromonas xiamenensis]|uniref:Sulfotransferase family 2 domain-containing protein n=1 Tax=Pseudoalteromonas xiamenensis TaxID=882626 RepID=A0A975DIY3_9GAMM|nr:sulfotransferase family 2 domain-containing protein [Pseudoalteromonas xiamenensis]QTH72587.1 sulfotransferase family 2 domain-containing protein [Pseudoalteromonas xiamenensis]